MNDLIDTVWDKLQADIADLKASIANVTNFTEQAQYVDGIPAYTFATLPSTGLANGSTYLTIAFCSNGRKAGQGAGNGTGVPVYWNAASSQWLKFSDDLPVSV